MKIVFDYPPIFDEIDSRFRVRGKRIIYAWGDKIYNPMRIQIPNQLMAHEEVHGERQGNDIEGWWRRYIDDDKFRLAEEIPAHQAEYQVMLHNAVNRAQRRRVLIVVAKRLASPIYGRMISEGNAKKLIKPAGMVTTG